MKNFPFFLATILMSLSLLAQTPQGINYQTIIRDGEGNILPDTELSLQMTIRSDAPDGEVVYQEIHDATTNAFGLVNLVIGQGAPQSGEFSAIDWAGGDKYLETAIDINASGTFTVLGVTQFLSVPYSFESKHSSSLTLTDENGNEYEIKVDSLGNLSADLIEAEWECGDIFVDNRDGKEYQTVQIGDQCWMAENLNIGERIDVSGEMTDNGIIEKYCYDDDPANCEIYGGLYQWNETMQYDTTSTKGICPTGWKIPTDEEWKILDGTADSQYPVGDPIWENMGFRGFDAGKNLKTTSGWYDNGNGTNLYGFSALPAGYRSYLGYFNSKGHNTFWWTTDKYSANEIWYHHIGSSTDGTSRYYNFEGAGFSIRCINDDANPPTTYNLFLETNPEGAGSVTGADQYEAGEQVNISAEASTGWEFVNWTDDEGVVSEVANFTFTMPAEDVTFTANFVEEQGGFTCGNLMIDPRDSQTYHTVQIGDQCWMAENLNIGERIDGSEEMTNNGTIEKYCYNDDPTNCGIFGGLYQWNEMMQYNTAGTQGICPDGWKIPTDEQWKTLEGTVDSQYPVGDPEWDNTEWRGFDAGLNLKSDFGWYTTNGTDLYGFSALPTGYRHNDGVFQEKNTHGYWWSIDETSATDAWYRVLYYNFDNVKRISYNKAYGLAIRCIKDEASPPTSFNLYLETNPEGAGSVTGAGQYEAGEQIDISAEASTGWEFVNWTDNDGVVSETANFTFTMPAEDITLTANFVEEQPGFTCGESLIDPRDGQSYQTVQLGDQCWMAENCAYLPEVSPPSQSSTTDPFYYVYNYQGSNVVEAKATANYQTYGVLYNWPAAFDACPEGFHLPTDAEWTALTDYVSSQTQYHCDNNPIYIAKALAATTNWNTTTGTCLVGNNPSANNATGFSGLPGGFFIADWGGVFGALGDDAYWWSSTENPDGGIWQRGFPYSAAHVLRIDSGANYGSSVRCLLD